jgi:hypothetical protein
MHDLRLAIRALCAAPLVSVAAIVSLTVANHLQHDRAHRLWRLRPAAGRGRDVQRDGIRGSAVYVTDG